MCCNIKLVLISVCRFPRFITARILSLKNQNTQAPDILFLSVSLPHIIPFALSTPFHMTDDQAANGLQEVPQIISLQKGKDGSHLLEHNSAVQIDHKME
jgi:hypothetical protein